MTREELVGQKLVLGIEGMRATPEITRLFRETHAGGLIFFRRNFESASQLRKLLSDLETSLGKRLLVMTDHEGGRVTHFSEGVTVFPDAKALGISGRVEWAHKQGEIEARELRALGLDLNLAPVLDVLTNERCPAIGTRSYGENPKLVAQLGCARIAGMQSKNLSACAKHFPGLGSAPLDPHGELPVIEKSWKALRESDLVPFLKAFEEGVDAVMSSHPVYSAIDSRPRPATFSRRLIHDCLRLELGFKGVALTDDLKMGAVSKSVSLREAVPLAAKAGHDLLLICSDPTAQRQAFDALLWAAKQKEISDSELEESVFRIEKLKAKRAERFAAQPVGVEREGRELVELIAKSAAKILKDGKKILHLLSKHRSDRPLNVFFPDLSSIACERFIEPELLSPDAFLKESFSRQGVKLKRLEQVSLDPDLKERAVLLESIPEGEGLVFFCWDAHQFRGARELLAALQKRVHPLLVVLLREPRDEKWIGPEAACLTAYGFRLPQVRALLEKMFSEK